MDTPSIDKIKVLNRTSKALSTFFDRFREARRQGDIDKYAAHFERIAERGNVGELFNIALSFVAYTGAKGHSNVHTFSSHELADRDLLQQHFLVALNSHLPSIFDAMARAMAIEAKSLTYDAQQELDAMKKALDEARKD